MQFFRKFTPLLIVALIIQLISPMMVNHTATSFAATNGPVVTSQSPANNANNVPVRPIIEVWFDESVTKNDLNKQIRIRKESTNTDVYVFPMSSSNVSISGSKLTLTLSADLELDTNYNVYLESGIVKNTSNSSQFTSDYYWRFKTVASVDNTPPTVTGISYQTCALDAATGQFNTSCTVSNSNSNINPTNTTLLLTFSEPVYTGTGHVILSNTNGADRREISVLSSEIVGSGSNTIAIRLSAPLLASHSYNLTVVGGNNANFVDVAGNKMPTSFNTNFTVASDNVQLSNYGPTGNDIELTHSGLNITMTFNQNVIPVAGKYIYIRNVNTNAAVGNPIPVRNTTNTSGTNSFTYPVSSLAPNTEYYITLDTGSFVSTSGTELFRGMLNTTSWKFKTKATVDTQAPAIVHNGLVPANNANQVPLNEKIVLQFNELVYVNTGNILIKEYNTNLIYRSINVTSTRITGAGTTTITIDPHQAVGNSEVAKTFKPNQRYYVEIPAGTLKDASNNNFAGITLKDSFNFTTGEIVNDKPLLVGISPVNGTDTVGITSPIFSLTFDKPIAYQTQISSTATINPKQTTNTVQPIALTPTGLSVDQKTIYFATQGSLVANTDYYITVPNNLIYDANSINNATLNYFDGILNTYQWTFRTLGGDRVAPKLLRAEASGNKVRLVYDELLDESSKPLIGNYYITVNGVTASISSLEVNKNSIVFTLYNQVSTNQQVFISYTKPVANPVRDLTGNVADNFVNQSAEHRTITTVPTIIKSSYSGKTITLEFNEPLLKVNELAYLQFVASVNNVNNPVTAIRQSGTKIDLTVTNTIASNRNVVLNYAVGAYPLKGFISDVNAFSLTVGQTSTGTTPVLTEYPEITSITANGNQISIVYNQLLYTQSYASQYLVSVNGANRKVLSTSLSNQTVTLTLESAVSSTDTVLVSYTGAGGILTGSNNNYQYSAQSFTNKTATVGSATTTKMALQSAIIKGDKLTLSFNKPLDTKYLPNESQFYIMISGNNWSIKNMKIEDTKLIITLSGAVLVGAEGSLSYFTTVDTLRATDGERVGMISNIKLTNQSTVLDILSDDYTGITNGVLLKESTATKSNTTSPSGRTVTQYYIDNAKITPVVDTFESAGMKNAEIRFEVPTSQQAAIVAFPVAALQNAAKKGSYTFSVKYGDIYFEVPTSAIDISKAVNLNKGSAFTNYLVLKIEKGSNTLTANLESSIRSNGATLVGGPYVFEASISGPSGNSEVPLTGNLVRKVIVPQSLSKSNTTAVFYDEVVGNISGVPTSLDVNGTTTDVTFMRPGTSAYAIVTNNKTFSDSTSHWAKDSILILSRKFIIEGHSATAFNPQQNITRGEFATYLVKGLGLSADKEAAKQFKDVNSASTLGGYIGAAVKAGIVSGVSATEFKPNAYITRQDMAIMMMRVVTFTKANVTLTSTPDSYLSRFTDANKVSSYAKTQVGHAIQIGIITGYTPTTISPLSNATRAEGVTMIERVLRKADYLQ